MSHKQQTILKNHTVDEGWDQHQLEMLIDRDQQLESSGFDWSTGKDLLVALLVSSKVLEKTDFQRY